MLARRIAGVQKTTVQEATSQTRRAKRASASAVAPPIQAESNIFVIEQVLSARKVQQPVVALEEGQRQVQVHCTAARSQVGLRQSPTSNDVETTVDVPKWGQRDSILQQVKEYMRVKMHNDTTLCFR